MHEAGLIQTALDLVAATARDHGPARVTKLKMRVGAWSGVVPEALAFAFEALRPHTVAATAVLDIEPAPVCCHCPKCGHDFQPPDIDTTCPACGEFPTELVGGRELELVSVEVAGP